MFCHLKRYPPPILLRRRMKALSPQNLIVRGNHDQCRSLADQCASMTGMSVCSIIDRVVPPKIACRIREWP